MSTASGQILNATAPISIAVAAEPPSQACRRELALLEAASYGQQQRAKKLLDAGEIDVDFVDVTGRAAIHHAAEHGDLEIVQALIRADCDVDSCSKTYGTALCLAVCNSHNDVVKALLDAGADVKGPGGGLGSALHCACRAGSLDLVELFVERGLPFDIVRITDANVLRGKDEFKIQFVRDQKYSYAKLQPIHSAARHGRVAVVSRLLDLGADVNAQYDSWSSTNRFTTIESVDQKDRHEGLSVLHIAARYGQHEVVKLLLARGADANATPNNLDSARPLHFAATGGNRDCITLLLDAGAPVDECKNREWTPLFSAVYGNNLECAEYLLSRGASVNARLDIGFTAMVYASSPAMVELLVRHGASLKDGGTGDLTVLQFVAGYKENESDVLNKMIDLGAEIDQRNSFGVTALFYAIIQEQKQNARTLLRRGASAGKLSRGYRDKLTTLVGDVPELQRQSKESSKDSAKSVGLLRRLLLSRKPPASVDEVASEEQTTIDDDEITLCGESIKGLMKE